MYYKIIHSQKYDLPNTHITQTYTIVNSSERPSRQIEVLALTTYNIFSKTT